MPGHDGCAVPDAALLRDAEAHVGEDGRLEARCRASRLQERGEGGVEDLEAARVVHVRPLHLEVGGSRGGERGHDRSQGGRRGDCNGEQGWERGSSSRRVRRQGAAVSGAGLW